MQTTFKHYSEEAQADLRALSRVLSNHPMTSQAVAKLDLFASLIWKSPKFRLPDNGEFFDTDYKAVPSHLRLPYPVTVFEYEVTRGDENNRPGDSPCRKRIVLAVEDGDGGINVSFAGLTELRRTGLKRALNLAGMNGSLFWFPGLSSITIVKGQFDRTEEHHEKLHQYMSDDGRRNVRRLPDGIGFKSEPWLGAGVPFESYEDLSEEACVVLGVLEILQCSNVKVEKVEPPRDLIKKHRKHSGRKLTGYHILTIPGDGADGTSSGGTHASPRQHLRRGHIRRLPPDYTRTTWVNACVVSRKNEAFAPKDYAISPSTQISDSRF